MLPRLRSQWPDLKLYLREETSQAACDALHRGQLDCVLLALPYACGDVEMADLFDDRLFVAFPPATSDPPAERSPPTRSTRPAAAARGWPLPEGPCARRLQPARAARRGGDAGHLAAHPGADGRQRARPDAACRKWRSRPACSTAPGSSRGRSRPITSRRIALVWRKGSPREKEFRLLADALREANRGPAATSTSLTGVTAAPGAPTRFRRGAPSSIRGIRRGCRTPRNCPASGAQLSASSR